MVWLRSAFVLVSFVSHCAAVICVSNSFKNLTYPMELSWNCVINDLDDATTWEAGCTRDIADCTLYHENGNEDDIVWLSVGESCTDVCDWLFYLVEKYKDSSPAFVDKIMRGPLSGSRKSEYFPVEGVSSSSNSYKCFTKSTSSEDKLQCANGATALVYEGCIDQESYRVRCPKDKYPCKNIRNNGKEFVCAKDCSNFGGDREDCFQATWSSWGDWSGCSASCGEGTETRSRTCSITGECEGDYQETNSCELPDCAIWSAWSAWSICSATCTSYRTRTCSVTGECEGDYHETMSCGWNGSGNNFGNGNGNCIYGG